jgi:putative Mg2+ transporter-C (MgtC) family protein
MGMACAISVLLSTPVTLAAAVSEVPGYTELLWRFLLAAVFAGLIGWERGLADKPVGRRTMILISVGAAAFTALGVEVVAAYPGGDAVRTDPTRVLAYVISGVGFLGAGAILHSKKQVSGLTTAASVWATAAIGAACGLGSYRIAYVLMAFVLVTLWAPLLGYAIRGEPLPPEPPNGEGPSVPGGTGESRKRSTS